MLRSLFIFILFITFLGCAEDKVQKEKKSIDIKVTWNLQTNMLEGMNHKAQFTLENKSDISLTSSNWAMYWNMAPRTFRQESITAPVSIEWINGDYYTMKPKEGFSLKPGEKIEIEYNCSEWMIKESDAPLGLYFAIDNGNAEHDLFIVDDYTIIPYEGPDQINRASGDLEPIPTPEWLYENYSGISELPVEEIQLIVPRPKNIEVGESNFVIKENTTINYSTGLDAEAEMLADFINEILSSPIKINESEETGSNIISLRFKEVETKEAYSLSTSDEEGIVISGDRSGVFYGTQSLKALIPIQNLGSKNNYISIPSVNIEDTPAFPYRGMHMDVGRNFNTIETVKRLLDAMAFYKLNKFHLNLTEDEGWRIEIEELPELTQVGAFRGHTTDDAEYLQPSYGSGPFTDNTYGYGNGYYTREEYIDLIQYAQARHIEIIPEVNVPGHSRSAIKAMEYRYRKYMEQGNEAEAVKYRLIDPDDTSVYKSAQWYTDNIICVCRESAFTFITTVIDDFIEMHEQAGVPLKMFHTGGDEVPQGAWTGSPLCEDYLNQHPDIDNSKNLQKDFFKKVDEYIDSKGLLTGGWEEVAMNFKEDGSWTPNDEFANSDVIPYIWNSLWGAEDLGNRLANAGYPVVLCNVTNFYFDLAYNKDPREPGLYWAGFVNTRDAFEFVPYDVFKSIKVDPAGKMYKDEDFEGKETLTTAGSQNVIGVQAQLWSETLKGGEMLEYYYLPKMMGMAERAWFGQATWGNIDSREERDAEIDKAWNSFSNTLGKREFIRLDHLNGGYNYRLAPPGAKVENNLLLVNTAYPGMEVRYTIDGSDPTKESPVFAAPLEVGPGTIKLSTFDSRGRSSFPTVINLQ